MSNIKTKKLGFLVTQVLKDELLLFTSRGLRKSLHKPKSISTWIAILFMIGSFLFAIASVFFLYPKWNISNQYINIIYFVGSIFFTSAAYLLYLEAINSDITNERHLFERVDKRVWFKICPNNLGYLSSITLFIGTLFFNVLTFSSLLNNLNGYENEIFIMTPNIIGCILFLISSFFAWLEIYHDEHIKPFKNYTWWIIWLNILGSIFFMVSALVDNIAVEMTLWGAICFFIASFLQPFETAPQEVK